MDEVVEVLAEFFEVEVGRVDFDFKGEDPRGQYFDSFDDFGSVLFVGLAILKHTFEVDLQKGDFVAEAMVFEFDGID